MMPLKTGQLGLPRVWYFIEGLPILAHHEGRVGVGVRECSLQIPLPRHLPNNEGRKHKHGRERDGRHLLLALAI